METIQVQDLVVGATERTVAALHSIAESEKKVATAICGCGYGIRNKYPLGLTVSEVATALERVGGGLERIAAATNKARLQATKDNRESIAANTRNRRFDMTTATLRRLALAKRG